MRSMRVKATTIQAACERRARAMSRLEGYTSWEGPLANLPKPAEMLDVYAAVVELGPLIVLVFGYCLGFGMVQYRVSVDDAMEALPA